MISIVGVAGLPRSGSTLLQQILGQNPAHHVTPTSGVPMLVRGIQQQWTHYDAFKAQGLENVEPRIANAILGATVNFYRDEIEQGKIIFDKSRMWPTCIEIMERCFNEEMKIILCVRDIPDILASYEKIYRNNIMYRQGLVPLTIEGRAMNLLREESNVGTAIFAVNDIFRRGFHDRLIVVPFNDLCTRPEDTLKMIHAELGLPDFEYDFNNVVQITHEDDTQFEPGYPPDALHTIREGAIEPPTSSWRDIYPEGFGNQLMQQYPLITKLNERR